MLFNKGKSYGIVTPELFLTLIRHAECIFTDSFHGTAFSINFNKLFISFATGETTTRIESLLNVFNLGERLIRDSNAASGDVLQLAEKEIDYHSANDILAFERERADQFLQNALSYTKEPRFKKKS
jgi:hypothetical protein